MTWIPQKFFTQLILKIPKCCKRRTWTAMMIPQVAGRLIDRYAKPKAVVLDSFSGSGSVLLEAFIKGYDSYGIDINLADTIKE